MSQTQKVTFDVRYTPDMVQKQIAGAKNGKGGRPFIFDIRFFKVQTKEGETVVSSYLLFGGVPSPNLHEQLEEAGFKVRRRQRTWTGKDKKVVDIAERDNECYAVYWNTEPTITDEQIKVLAGIMKKGVAALPKRKKTFLCPTWDAVEKLWGDKDKWLAICTVGNDNDDDDDIAGSNAIDLDDVVDVF